MENSWTMFNHVKCLKYWTIMECHVYDTKYYKVLTVACCDMKCEDNAAQTLFWKYLNVVRGENGVVHVNFKGFMADNAQANWNVVRKTYGNGDPTMPMEDYEHTYHCHWFANLDKSTQKPVKLSLLYQHKQFCKYCMDVVTIEDVETKYHLICS